MAVIIFADYLHPNQRSATGFASAAYPTPATDAVTLTFDSEPSDGALTVEVLTMTGLPVRHLELPAPSQRGARPVAVPLADLPTGLYTYRLTTTQGVSVGKFIKE